MWTPGIHQGGGQYHIRLIAADAVDQTLRNDLRITITVTGDSDGMALSPDISAPATAVVQAGESLSYRVSASNSGIVVAALMSEELPRDAVFTDNGNGTCQFFWTTDDADLGIHVVIFRAVSPYILRSTETTVSIQVKSETLAVVDVAALDNAVGITVIGSAFPSNAFGRSVSRAGDVDGLDDVIIGELGAKSSDCENCNPHGAAYVLFGSRQGFADVAIGEPFKSFGVSIEKYGGSEVDQTYMAKLPSLVNL